MSNYAAQSFLAFYIVSLLTHPLFRTFNDEVSRLRIAEMGPKKPLIGTSPAGAGKRKVSTLAFDDRKHVFLAKRAKLHQARTIPAQPADAALHNGELDLQAFLAAHEFEIKSLEQSMATSKNVNTSRAFQKVPRVLRRRTASHNPRRVPRRLRARARKEMKDDNTPLVESRRRKPKTTRARIRLERAKELSRAVKKKRRKRGDLGDVATSKSAPKGSEKVIGRTPRPKIRRNMLNEPPKPASKFRKRQISKTWLPTHTWHAKRARMTQPKDPLWRFAIPMTPNEKIYRPTHRAQGSRGALIWDQSYMSTIGLYGSLSGIERVLKRIGVTQETYWGERGAKWRRGTRAWTGILHKERRARKRQVCPATIFWNPVLLDKDADQHDGGEEQRQVFIRVHPAAFLEVFEELLRLIRMENPRLYIEDLRFEIGSMEISGPASTEALLAVLTSHDLNKSNPSQHAKLFRSLGGISNSASLPANAILSFNVVDPRLRYPPKRVESSMDTKSHNELQELIVRWPADEQRDPSHIFSRDARHKASLLPSQKSINRRRGGNAPGTYLKPTSADPPIPIVLIATRSTAGLPTQNQGSWTLMLPWKCVLPFWYSFVHCPLTSGGNPTFAGLQQSMQVNFERGLPWFPADFIGCDAGITWELEQRQKRKIAWTRRPKSKRVNWSSLNLGSDRKGEIGDGLACDFEYLLGSEQLDDESSLTSQQGSQTQNEVGDKDLPSPKKHEAATSALQRLEQVSKAVFNSAVSAKILESVRPTSILIVRMSLLSRGVVTPCARIYRLPSTAPPASSPILLSPDAEVPATPQTSTSSLVSDLRAQWLKLAKQPSSFPANRSTRGPRITKDTNFSDRKRLLLQEILQVPSTGLSSKANVDDIGGHPLVPDASDLIGFVTTGSYCLSEGKGMAIGTLVMQKVVDDVRQNVKEGKLCIVRNAGENVGRIARWEPV